MCVPYIQFGGSGDLEMWWDIQLSTSQYRLDVADLLEMGILCACSTFSILDISKLSKEKRTCQTYSVVHYCKTVKIRICNNIAPKIQSKKHRYNAGCSNTLLFPPLTQMQIDTTTPPWAGLSESWDTLINTVLSHCLKHHLIVWSIVQKNIHEALKKQSKALLALLTEQ